MFCSQCGHEVSPEHRFCAQCGTAVNQPSPFLSPEVERASHSHSPLIHEESWATPQGEPQHLAQGYAGFWRRVVAYVVDYVITLVVGFVIGFFLLSWLLESNQVVDVEQVEIYANGIGFFITWLYFALMESSSKQATFGKIILGAKVVDVEGQRISFGRATGRHFGKILSALLLGIGFIMVAFTQRKQGLHDMLARTLVVNC